MPYLNLGNKKKYFMPLNYPENRKNIEAKKGNDLETEISKLKKILEVKEQEMRSITGKEKPVIAKEISGVKEKLKNRSVEFEKIKEKTDNGEGKQAQDAENFFTKRQTAPTAAQLKALDDQLKNANVQHQLTLLANMALVNSVYYAIKKARDIGNAYLLDRLHDMIVNEMYEELVRNKKIKPIK